jgi:hypothetical protein
VSEHNLLAPPVSEVAPQAPAPRRLVAFVYDQPQDHDAALNKASATVGTRDLPIRYCPPWPMSENHRFTKYLTLAEQIESVLRYHGKGAEEAGRYAVRILTELSDPAVPGLPELVRWGRCLPSAEVPDDVLWRVGFARTLAAIPTNITTSLLLVSLRAKVLFKMTSRWRVKDQIGRYLHQWSRTVSSVSLIVDDKDFANQFADTTVPALPAHSHPTPHPEDT